MSTRNLNATQPAKNISAKPPSRKVDRGDGVMVTEKLSPIPFSRKMVAPDGDVVAVALANGFTIRGFKGNDYGVQIWAEKLAAGFIPFDECPYAKGHLKRGDGDEPCKGGDGLGKFTNDKCCPHVDKVIQARRAEHRAAQMEYDKNFHTQQDRLIAALEKQAAGMLGAERPVQGKGRMPGG